MSDNQESHTTDNAMPIAALVYDFDGTLSPGNMQEFGFIQAIGRDKEEFWRKNHELAQQNDANNILCYMYSMLQAARASGISLRRESFQRFGAMVDLFPGVRDWFWRINAYGRALGLQVKHYINSSGLKEMIEGTPIAGEFEDIFASSYLYDVDGIAYWPAVAVDYTAKTQFLFKINKGIHEVSDNMKINRYVPEEERPVPFRRMIYFGDGETDIPSMKMAKSNGGHSIAVYRDPNHRDISQRLIHEGRVNFTCLADYSEHSELENIVQHILRKIKADWDVSQLQNN